MSVFIIGIVKWFLMSFTYAECLFSSLSVGRRHAHAWCCENKQIQDDQAADDARSKSQNQELCKYRVSPHNIQYMTPQSLQTVINTQNLCQ